MSSAGSDAPPVCILPDLTFSIEATCRIYHRVLLITKAMKHDSEQDGGGEAAEEVGALSAALRIITSLF